MTVPALTPVRIAGIYLLFLWLVRLIVENAGGTVSLDESSLGGAAVTVTVPRVEEAPN